MTISLGKVTLAALVLLTSLGLAAPVPPAQEEHSQDHDQLRALLKRGAEALNTRQLDSMAPYLHPEFTLVTVDNHKLKGIAELKTYLNELFDGETPIFKSMEVRPEADDLTTFLDEDSGVVYGTSNDRYTFSDGDVREMSTRWTAVVQKDGETWKLVSVHFSANLLDNPVIDAAKTTARRLIFIVGGIGLAAGLVIGFLVRRRSS
jgi:ketosteroid isomerase-like protein